MIAQWMLYAVLLGLAVGVVTLAAEYALRLYGRSTRWLWATSLVAALALPLAAWLLTSSPPPVRLELSAEPVLQTEPIPIAPAAPAAPVRVSAWQRLAGLEGRIDGNLPWVWLGTSLLAALALALSYARLRRQRRSWAETDVDGVAVLVSGGTGPAVVGLRRARIVVPAWVLQEPEARRRMILAHEAEHLAAGDARLLTGALAALVAAPWNPLVWWQIRRLRLAAEVDCDARVLRRGTDLRGYAGLLLDVGMRFGEGGALAAFAEPRSLLARRLRALTAPLPRRRGWRVAAGLAGAAVVVAGACVAPRPPRPLSATPRSLSFLYPASRIEASPPTDGLIGKPVPAVVDTPPPARRDTLKVTAPGLARGPQYTPYDVGPELVNRADVQAALVSMYPPLLKSAGVGGSGDFWALVDRQGQVMQARVRSSTGRAELDSAALRVVEMMHFTPALNRGQPTEVWITVPITFKPTGTPALPGENPAPPSPSREQILAGPIFTPYTAAPELSNRDDVRAALAREYPPAAKVAGDSGTVLVWELINEQGGVEKAQLRKSSGKPAFDSAALRVAKVMRFKPAQLRGNPTLVWVMLPIIFRSAEMEAKAQAENQARFAAEYAGLPPVNNKSGIPGLPEGYTPPMLINSVQVYRDFRSFYPQGVQAPHWAWVKVTIAADGSTSGLALDKSSGNAQVDALALSVAQRMRFDPAVDGGGKPATITTYFPFSSPTPPAASKDTAKPRGDAGKRPNVAALVAPLAAAVVVHR